MRQRHPKVSLARGSDDKDDYEEGARGTMMTSGDPYLDAKTAQGVMLEKLAEAALSLPIDLDPLFNFAALTNLRRIRTRPGCACIAYACDQGVLLRDRHTKMQYLLTTGHLEDMIERSK
jgi:hypothetical protein